MEQAAVAAPGDARAGYFYEDLEIGMSAEFSRVIGDEEMRLFADLTGDTNPLHFDDEFAEQSRFGGRIVHGMCTAALISTVIGTRLPGTGLHLFVPDAPLHGASQARRRDRSAGRGGPPDPGAPPRRVRDHMHRGRGDRAFRPRARPGPVAHWAGVAGGSRVTIARILELARRGNTDTTPPPFMIRTDGIAR